jgi:hypothetical protein
MVIQGTFGHASGKSTEIYTWLNRAKKNAKSVRRYGNMITFEP